MRSIRIDRRGVRGAIVAASCVLVVACGGDDEADDEAAGDTSGALTSSTETSSSSDASSGGGDDGSSSGGDTTTSAESSGGADGSTTGGPEDPSYPQPDAGMCPNDTVPIELPGGSVCGPFCAGPDATCPAPSSGDAEPTCTPFADDGGSGTPCRTHDECADGEACDPGGTCIAVAFWACRLVCDGGQACSDGMTCTAGACGYP